MNTKTQNQRARVQERCVAQLRSGARAGSEALELCKEFFGFSVPVRMSRQQQEEKWLSEIETNLCLGANLPNALWQFGIKVRSTTIVSFLLFMSLLAVGVQESAAPGSLVFLLVLYLTFVSGLLLREAPIRKARRLWRAELLLPWARVQESGRVEKEDMVGLEKAYSAPHLARALMAEVNEKLQREIAVALLALGTERTRGVVFGQLRRLTDQQGVSPATPVNGNATV